MSLDTPNPTSIICLALHISLDLELPRFQNSFFRKGPGALAHLGVYNSPDLAEEDFNCKSNHKVRKENIIDQNQTAKIN